MYQFKVILKRDFINLATNPTLLLLNTVFPVLLILILGFLGNGNYGNTGVDAYDYYGVSLLVFSVLYVSMTASNAFMEKRVRTSNLRAMYSPIRKSSIYMSKILSTFLFSAPCYLVMMALASLLLGVDYGGARMGYIIALMLLFDLMSCALGVLFCCIFKSEEGANKILSLICNIMAILGGLFFPLDGFGRAAAIISIISPVKWVVHSMLAIIYDGNLASFIPTVLILSGLTTLFIFGCKKTFKTEDYV